MGGKTDARRKLPAGVEIRSGARGDKLRITFYFRGVRCRETLDVSASEPNIRYAKNLIGEIENAIARQTFDYRAYFPKSKAATRLGVAMVPAITVGQMLDDYLAIAEKNLSPSTVRGYKEVTAAHLRPQFGHVQVRHLTPAMLRAWMAGLQLTHKRVKNILCPLSNILKQALTDEIIQSNPLDKIVLDKVLQRTRKSDYEVDPFDRDEIAAILDACGSVQDRSLWQFAFSTGLRTSELIALQWQDIDARKQEFRVQRSKVVGHEGPVEKDETKTRAGTRDVPMLPGAVAALEAIRPITYMAQAYVFINPRTGKQWMDDKQLRETSWRRILRKAGVRYRNPYQTRHTFATTLLMNGESELLVAELLGHETTEMLRRHYARWIKTASKRPKGDYSSFATSKNLGQIWGSEAPSNPAKSA